MLLGWYCNLPILSAHFLPQWCIFPWTRCLHFFRGSITWKLWHLFMPYFLITFWWLKRREDIWGHLVGISSEADGKRWSLLRGLSQLAKGCAERMKISRFSKCGGRGSSTSSRQFSELFLSCLLPILIPRATRNKVSEPVFDWPCPELVYPLFLSGSNSDKASGTAVEDFFHFVCGFWLIMLWTQYSILGLIY